MKTEKHVWSSEVRDYEIDFQGIVNNAVYLNYLQQARAEYFLDQGHDVVAIAHEGINIVIFETNLKFKKSLRFRDKFTIKSELSRISHFKFLMQQTLTNTKTGEICFEAKNYLCCIDTKTNKPCLHHAFENMPITE